MYYPLRSLREGHWFKLICGASFQHLPAIRSLALSYTLAGIDCIDVAADPAVVSAVREALSTADLLREDAIARGYGFQGLPWLMVSLNDGEDPHFRKAEFDPLRCPSDCPRPCEAICPASAIVFDQVVEQFGRGGSGNPFSGVIDQRCYGCGRCLPLCPIQQIETRSYISTPATIAPLMLEVDAVEIHTQVGRLEGFRRLWEAIAPVVPHLKLVAVSCPDGEGLIEYLQTLAELMGSVPRALVWQTDGRPMSGDIGKGTTRAAIKLGQKVLAAGLPGYVQLAGGTNAATVPKLRAMGLLPSTSAATSSAMADIPPRWISGVAYGSYARVLLSPILEALALPAPISPPLMSSAMMPDARNPPPANLRIEDVPNLLWQAVDLAHTLVSPLKSAQKFGVAASSWVS